MDEKRAKKTSQAGLRIPPETIDSLMKFKANFASKTDLYSAAFNFYLEAAERFGVDSDMRPRVAFVKAKDGPSLKTANKKEG